MSDVPFPRTVPDDAPEPADDAIERLDWRAAQLFFEDADDATAYRMTPDGVILSFDDDSEVEHNWDEVKRVSRRLRDDRGSRDIRRAP